MGNDRGMAPLLETGQVTKAFGKMVAVNRFDLHVERGKLK